MWFLINLLIRCRFPHVHHIRVEELDQWLEESDSALPLLLDARTYSEYQISHLYQAQPISDNLDSLLKLKLDRPIVVYCSIGYRSALIVAKLQNMGHQKVFNLTGSLFQWATKGYNIYQGQQVVRQIHPYNNGWKWLLSLMLDDHNFIEK
ncbi:MAG: rhodanese-like domain-containing protein [Microcystaceae cyanobacterium]